MTPFFATVFLLSLAVNLAPIQTGLQGGSVQGFWDDLLGSGGEKPQVVTLSSAESTGSSRIFLQVTGIEGESTEADHDGWIDVLSFTMGLSDPGGGATGSTRRRGTVVVDDIVVVKELDKSSPKLMEKCAGGMVIPSLVIEMCAGSGDSRAAFYRYTLENVMVTSFYCSGTDDDVPVETFTLSFEEITVTYTEIDALGKAKGNVEFSYRVEEGETG
ncbi:type VI secretion system tube protein Hcp [Candidatus Bathyarchaeota archaeon]|nr:type VI secretion system tube protein Hcp [Candidatus Bathyarchaeota archaeon]